MMNYSIRVSVLNYEDALRIKQILRNEGFGSLLTEEYSSIELAMKTKRRETSKYFARKNYWLKRKKTNLNNGDGK